MGRTASWCVVGLALVLAGCGGGGGGGGNQGGTGAQLVTALGAPSGTPVSDSIDSTGGEITDGASFKLTVPAGALAAATDVTVTPETNGTTPWGDPATGYAVTGLDDITAPVTMSIGYSGEETPDPSADTLGMAMQDDQGRWWEFPNPTWDGSSLTVDLDPAVLAGLAKPAPESGGLARGAGSGGPVRNPRVYLLERMRLQGPREMFVDQHADYVLTFCSRTVTSSQLRNAVVAFREGACRPIESQPSDANWTVDDVPNGNSTEGTVVKKMFTAQGISGSFPGVQYNAPHQIPAYQQAHGFVKLKADYVRTTPHENRVALIKLDDYGAFTVEAKYDNLITPVCASASPTDLHDSVIFDLAPVPDTDVFDVSNIHDSKTKFTTPGSITFDLIVVNDPEFLNTTNITATRLHPASGDVVEVTIFGTQTGATCWYKDPTSGEIVIKEEGHTSPASGITTFQFNPDPSAFTDYKQTVPADYNPDIPGWHYVITEMPAS
jgi:hypothetical protein